MDTYSPAIYRGDVPQLRYARAREVKSWQDLNQVPVVYGFNQQSHHAVAVTPASRRGGTAGTSNKLTHVGNSTVFGSDRKGVESTRRSREHPMIHLCVKVAQRPLEENCRTRVERVVRRTESVEST
ncbi:MAG: hypothetical protein P9E88_17555 [Candidatus Competibacter sp.]|nr:hypothetical protein [Candidatus Competibacter sp.]